MKVVGEYGKEDPARIYVSMMTNGVKDEDDKRIWKREFCQGVCLNDEKWRRK